MEKVPKLIIPTFSEIIIYLFAALLVLFVANITPIASSLTEGYSTNISSVAKDYITGAVSRTDGSETLRGVTTGLYWASVGAVVYMLLWVAGMALMAAKHEVEFSHMITNRSVTTRRRFVAETAARGFFRLSAIILIGFLTVTVVQVWYPVFTELFRALIYDWTNYRAWISAGFSVVGLAVILFTYTVLIRLALLRVRVFNS